jgi:hypothetical protein
MIPSKPETKNPAAGPRHRLLNDLLNRHCRYAQPGRSPVLRVLGHVGVGHAHSHSGIVQDDSVGFTCAISLLRHALPVDLRISSAEADPGAGEIRVTTRAGGIGVARPRRGITPQERELIHRVIGYDASFCQSLACHAFGRIYGQGVAECAACLEAAAAFAAVDSFRRSFPQAVWVVETPHGENRDLVMGGTLEVMGQPVSVASVVNFTEGGLGPNENAEGNTLLAREDVSRHFGTAPLPTIVVESKAYVPAYCQNLGERSLLTRVNSAVDNTAVAEALIAGAQAHGLPMIQDFSAYPRNRALKQQTAAFGAKLKALGESLGGAESSPEKVRIIATLAQLVSEDAGSVTFMSNETHSSVGSAGCTPGTAAVLSMLVPPEEAGFWQVPVLFREDLDLYLLAVLSGIEAMKIRLPDAVAELQRKYTVKSL